VRNSQDQGQKARNYAFLLLKFRPRSCRELEFRLKRKKFSPQVIKDTLLFLEEKGFIDDASFCRAWLNSRLKTAFGLRRIRQELKLKGVKKEIIDEVISEVAQDYSEEEIVADIAESRMNKLKSLPLEAKRRRVYGYLARRGFSPEVIIEALNNLCR
jgi:regulatory protein